VEWRRAEAAQAAMLATVPIPLDIRRVAVQGGLWINTLRTTGAHLEPLLPLQRPALVLLHGWAGALGLWRDNLPGLAQHYTVYAIDFLGWGLSSRPVIPGDMAAVVRQKVETLKQWSDAMGLHEFTLVGHSLGGYVAARFALAFPEVVTRLVLVCASDIILDERKDQLTYRSLAGVEVMMGSSIPLGILRQFEAIGAGPWLLRRIYSGAISPEEIEYILACAALPRSGEAATIGRNRQQAFMWHDLHKFTMRVDMIVGDQDATIPPKLGEAGGAEMAFSRLKHPGRLIVIKGADHSCYRGIHVDAFNSAVLDGDLQSPAVGHPWHDIATQIRAVT